LTGDHARVGHARIGIDGNVLIYLASARQAGATVFVTNDRRIRSMPQLEVSYLDELG
jgi:hypothetical protein